MKASVLCGVRDVQVTDVPDPGIEEPTDVLVRITLGAVCGSDLWYYRGQADFRPGDRMGHEWVGIVEEIGSEVTGLRRGDFVVAPFAFADGTCPACLDGFPTSCPDGGSWGRHNGGGQAEAIRVPFADATLVAVRADVNAELARRLLPLTDVMATGHHAAIIAGSTPGEPVVVIGDGAVGLCGVLAACRLGAEPVVAVGRHADRADVALGFGATHTLDADDPGTVASVLELTRGGAAAVAECVGTQSALDLAMAVVRPGGTIGSVGVPYGIDRVDLYRLFRGNVALRCGVAPVRRYLDGLVAEVLAGTLDPSPVLTTAVDLADIATAYHAMDSRQGIKATVRPSVG